MTLAVFAVGPAELIILVAVVVLVAFKLSGRGLALRRRPRKRHLVVRIVCGAVAAIILVAITVGTWNDVRRCYATDDLGKKLTVRVPSKPAPALPVPAEQYGRTEVEKARFLFHVVVADFAAGAARPVHVEEHEVRWPRDKMQVLERRFRFEDFEAHYTLVLPTLYVRRGSEGEPPVLQADGTYSVGWRCPGRSSSRSGGLSLDGVWYAADMARPRVPGKRPLSIAAAPRRDLKAFGFVTRAAEDDPLHEVALDAFLEQREADMRRALANKGDRATIGHRLPADIPLRGLALAAHIGLSSLLLLVAASLLSQLFVRRSLAFVGVLAAVVLYVAVLDRTALGAHLSRLSDAAAPLPARVVACRQATDTFFYAGTALAAVRSVADDAAAPAPLRQAAADVARSLADAP